MTVQPFASLPSLCEDGVPRLLINLQRVGDLGSRPDDVLLLEDCDSGVKKLADHLGWGQDLASLRDQTKVSTFSSVTHLSLPISRAWNINLARMEPPLAPLVYVSYNTTRLCFRFKCDLLAMLNLGFAVGKYHGGRCSKL